MVEYESLTVALSALQGKLPVVEKLNSVNAGSRRYKYADLTLLSSKVMPLLSEHGLAFVSMPTIRKGRFVLRYELRHRSGHKLRGYYPLPESAPQDIGSAITYARRYALCAVTGVAPGGDDDDAQKAQADAVRVKPTKLAAVPAGLLEAIAASESVDQLREFWDTAGKKNYLTDEVKSAITKRKEAVAS